MAAEKPNFPDQGRGKFHRVCAATTAQGCHARVASPIAIMRRAGPSGRGTRVAVQLGFVIGTAGSALFNLADVVPAESGRIL
jgi:hypothetical protein